MTKLLSIIIPVYNAEKYIERCLLSILQQHTFLHLFEIIIVNDGSTDNTCEIIREIEHKHLNISLYSQENAGVSAARNYGVSKARGKYIQFLDADDYLETDSYSIILDKINSTDFELLFFKYRLCYANETREGDYNKKFKDYGVLITGEEIIYKYGFHYSACLCLINRDFLIKSRVKFTSEIWGEDILFLTELLFYCKRAIVIDKVIYNYVMYNTESATHCIDKHHQLRLAQSYRNVSFKLRDLISNQNSNISNKTALFVIEDSNLYIILSIIKMVKYDAPIEMINEFYSVLKQKNVLPIKSISIYANFIIKISYYLFNYRRVINCIYYVKRFFEN